MPLLLSAAAVLVSGDLPADGQSVDCLTATLLAFSAHYLIYYSHAINTEVIVDLRGVLLVFHSMVVFVQEGRLRQLVGKMCGRPGGDGGDTGNQDVGEAVGT